MIAAELMTENPRTIRRNDTLEDAWEALLMQDARHLPVVDDDGNLVGMLSDRDFAAARASDGAIPATLPVLRLMSGSVVSVAPDTDVHDVIDLLLEHRIGAVPVVDGEGDVVGIVSYVDVLRSYAQLLREEERSSRSASPRAAQRSQPG